MDLHHLRTFVVVADEASVTKAAERLYMTPPTISGHIKALEEELNIVLFERTSRGMKLTEKGCLLKAKAEQTLRAAQDFVNQATALQSDLIGVVRIGLNASPSFLRMGRLTAELGRTHPGIALNMVASATGKILDGVQAGQLDMGFVFGEVAQESLHTVTLAETPLVIALPAPFVSADTPLDWAAMGRMPWVHTGYYCPFQERIDRLFGAHGVTVLPRVTADDEQTRLGLVRSGVGASLLIAVECETAVATGEIVLYEAEEGEKAASLMIPLRLVYPAVRKNEPLLQAIIEMIKEIWETT